VVTGVAGGVILREQVYLNPALKKCSRKYWEIIADNLSKAGWSWGCVSALDSEGRTMWIVDAHRDEGKRFIVRADEKLTAFLELEGRFKSSLDKCV